MLWVYSHDAAGRCLDWGFVLPAGMVRGWSKISCLSFSVNWGCLAITRSCGNGRRPFSRLPNRSRPLWNITRRPWLPLMRHLGLVHGRHHAVELLAGLDDIRSRPANGRVGQAFGFEEAARDLIEDLQKRMVSISNVSTSRARKKNNNIPA